MDSESLTTPTDNVAAELAAARALLIAGHEFRLFAEVNHYIAALVADIRTAERRVWVESYIFADDDAGRAVAAALTERAQAGVEVRVMYDAIGSLRTPAKLFEPLLNAGAKIHVFHSLWEALRRFAFFRRFNRRNHRKLVVIDDRLAYFGGMNIVDQREIQSAEDVKNTKHPPSSGWRDVHTRMVGPRFAEVAAAMEWLWKWCHDEKVERRPKWRLAEAMALQVDGFELFDADPHNRKRRVERLFLELIHKSQATIMLSVAYFLPTGPVLRALEKARRRGVEVAIVVPGVSDVKPVQYATRYLYARLLKKGFRVYERQERMLHSKVMVVDRDWTMVGSANLDTISLHYNLEYVGVFRSQGMADSVDAICDEEIENSLPVTKGSYQNRRWWERARDRICWSFRKWL